MTREIARNTVLLQSTSLLRGKTQWKWEHFILTELQSTSLLRGKTSPQLPAGIYGNKRFNPLPSCEGRPSVAVFMPDAMSLQSTSLLRGKTFSESCFLQPQIRFNPLPSCEGRPHVPIAVQSAVNASIHFPLAREDCPKIRLVCRQFRFNPLPSCEGRPNRRLNRNLIGTLQSTSLLRGKTYDDYIGRCNRNASIHFPLAREDAFLETQ